MVRKSKYFLLLTLIVCGTFVATVHAAGMTVSPAYIRFSIANDKSVDTATITVRNDSSQAVQYKAEVTDVSSDTGVLAPLDSVSTVTKSTFGLSVSDFTLQSGQSINIVVKATNTGSLAPGGHYAAATVRQVFAVKNRQQPLTQIVSVGIFLTKEDGATRQVKLRTQPTKSIQFRTIKKEDLLFTNTGNVEVVPRAVINITRGTQTYQKALVNESSSVVFPGKDRSFDASYTKLKAMPIGRYTKTIAYRYDGQKDQTIVTENFWYVPISFVSNCVVLLLLLLLTFIVKRRKHAKNRIKSTPSQAVDSPSVATAVQLTTIEDMTKNAIRTSHRQTIAKKVKVVAKADKKAPKKKKSAKTKPTGKKKKTSNKTE